MSFSPRIGRANAGEWPHVRGRWAPESDLSDLCLPVRMRLWAVWWCQWRFDGVWLSIGGPNLRVVVLAQHRWSQLRVVMLGERQALYYEWSCFARGGVLCWHEEPSDTGKGAVLADSIRPKSRNCGIEEERTARQTGLVDRGSCTAWLMPPSRNLPSRPLARVPYRGAQARCETVPGATRPSSAAL